MALKKVIEVLGSSPNSWEEATQNMVSDASKTVRNIQSVYIKDLSAKVVDNKITEYRINGKITFEVKTLDE